MKGIAFNTGKEVLFLTTLTHLTSRGLLQCTFTVTLGTDLYLCDTVLTQPHSITDVSDLSFLINHKVLLTLGADLEVAYTLIGTAGTPYL